MALALLVAAVVGRCDFYNSTDPSGYFCSAGAPAVYDLADVMNLTTVGAPGLFLHAVEGTRAAEVDDAPACNCRALTPKWMAMTLPSEFGDSFDDSIEDNCELTSLGFAWDVAPDGIYPTVLTIPPGRSVDAFAVFSGMPMKNMTEEDATTQYNFTFDGNPPNNQPPVKDYARTDINPDDACDVRIKWPSSYAISVGTGYCVADKTDNVNDFYTPYDFLPYTEDGFPDFDYPFPAPADIRGGFFSQPPKTITINQLIASGCSSAPNNKVPLECDMTSYIEIDPLGITAADTYKRAFMINGKYGLNRGIWGTGFSADLLDQCAPGYTSVSSTFNSDVTGEDDDAGYLSPLQAGQCVRNGASPSSPDHRRLPFFPFNTDEMNTINDQSALPGTSSTVGRNNHLKATYSLSVRIFLQAINWYMAELTVAINDPAFWAAAAGYIEPYDATSNRQICRGVDTSTTLQNKGLGPLHYSSTGQCISVATFGNRAFQTILMRHTMRYKTEQNFNRLYLQNAFALGYNQNGNDATYFGVEWGQHAWSGTGPRIQPMNNVNKQQYFIATGLGVSLQTDYDKDVDPVSMMTPQPKPIFRVQPYADFRYGGATYGGVQLDLKNNGYSQRLAWKDSDDIGDSFNSEDGFPGPIIEFFAHSAAINQDTNNFGDNGFNVSSLFPAFATTFSSTGSDPLGDKYAPYSYCDLPLPLSLADFEKCDEIYKCQINQHLCPTNIPGANIEHSYLRLQYPRLGPAHFSFPTHFVRPNETWSLAYIGESGLWAVPSVYRTQDYKSEHCMTASMPVPDTKVDETTICRTPGWNTKALEKDGIEAAVGVAAFATGDYVLGGAVAVEGLIGLGKSIFDHETAKPICHRYTTHDYGTFGVRKAVTEKLKYLDPRPNKDARFTESAGLTRLQLEDWCNAATVESDCSIPDLEYLTADNATDVANDINDRMKFRWLGCEWRQYTQKCVYRTVPLCHLWDLVYPESLAANRPLQNCQPYEGNTPVWPLDGSRNTATSGFSPCVVIQQIFKEPQEGENKMLPIPGTSMYLTAHKPLEDYENLRCVPLVTKIEVNSSNYKDLLRSGQLHREQNGVNCADPSSAADPDYAEICSRDLSFISGPSTGSQLANGIDYATNIHQQTMLQPFLDPFLFFDKESALLDTPAIDPTKPARLEKLWAGGGKTNDIPPMFSVLRQTRTRNRDIFTYQMFENGGGPQNYTDPNTKQVFQPVAANVGFGNAGKDFPTCSIKEAFNPATGFGDRMTGLGLGGCALAIDNITDIACKRVARGKWPTTCTKPGMQFFAPDQFEKGNTILFPHKAWQSVNPITRTQTKNLLGFKLEPTQTVFPPRDNFTFGSEAEAKLFPHAHYCEMAFSTYIGCDNDPLSLETRRKLCTEQYGGILFGGARIIKVKNPCSTIGGATTCWVFPGSNYGTVKSVLSLSPSPDTVKIVPFAWEVISTLMLNVLASNTTLTNYPTFWETLEKLKMNATTAEHRIALVQEAISKTQEADLIQGMCRGGTPSDAIIDSLHTIIENARIDGGGNYSFAGVESGTRIKNFTEAEVYPTLSEVGTDVVIRDVLITAAIQSRPPRFRPAGKECTVFQASGVGISFSDLEFDLTGCPEADAPIIFSGDTAAGALVENITTIGAKGATVLFLGRDTTAFLRSPELAVTGAVVRNIIMKPEDASFVPVAFAATVDSATVGTLDLSNRCDVWTATSPTTATVSVTAPDLLLSGTFTLVDLTLQNGSGCLKINNGRLSFGSPPCALWWLTEGAGVHPFGSPALCPNPTSSAITFCKKCAIGFQEPIFDDKPRTPQWSMDAGFAGVPDVSEFVQINSDGMCIDINGVASPCHQSALVPAVPVPIGDEICEGAVGIDRFACSKDPTGSVVAVNPPNCTSGGAFNAIGEFSGRGANFECVDGKYKITAGGYGYRDKENIRGLPGIQVRVETVYIQPGDDKLFDISLARGIGVFNVTEFTSAFGSVYEHEVHPASAHHTLTLYIFAIVGTGVLGLLVAFHLVEAWEGGA